MMPSVGPDYPEAYVCSIAVMADNDESKLVTADLIIDEFGWDPWVRYTNEPEKVDVHQEGARVSEGSSASLSKMNSRARR
jgi:hypothetical protein